MKISVCVCSCQNTPIITTISKTISAAAMRKRFNAPLAALPGLIFRKMADNKAGGLLRCCTLHTREEKTIDANFYALLMRGKISVQSNGNTKTLYKKPQNIPQTLLKINFLS